MTSKKISLFLIAPFIILCFAGGAMAASTYPSREIQVVTSSSPGGFVDTTLRLVTAGFARAIGAPVIVSNRPGAGGATGTTYLVKSKPDGYTIGCISSKDTVVTPATIPHLPFTYTDLDPLLKYARDTTVVFVKGDAPWKTLEELVADAGKRSGAITFGATTNSVSHFLMESFLRQAGVSLLHVPLKNAGETIIRVLGGNLDVGVSGLTPIAGQLKAGNLRALFIANARRNDLFPQIPTLLEKGYREPVLTLYTGFYAPRGLPRSIRKTIVTALKKAVQDPALEKKFEKIGAVIDYSPGEALAREIKTDYTTIHQIVESLKSRRK